jgi:hypothetical protein
MSVRLIVVLVISMLISACGVDKTSTTTSVVDSGISGGSPSLPTELNLAEKHAISTDAFINYFKYTAIANEKLLIQATLNTPLTNQHSMICQVGGISYITIYTENFELVKRSGCQPGRSDLTHTFVASGTYILYFNFPPETGGGYANVASI